MVSDKDVLFYVMKRDSQRKNVDFGYWYSEVVKAIKETPKTYVIEFDGNKHTLKKLSKGGSVLEHWNNYDDTISFRKITTANNMYYWLRENITYLDKKIESLKIELAACKGKGEWMPVD